MSIRELLEARMYWGNVAGGVLPYCQSTGRFLLALRSEYVNEPNTWNLWGGKIDEEDGETEAEVQDAVRREFKEETGFHDKIIFIPSYVYKVPTFRYYNFIGIVDEEFEPELNWESSDFAWLTLDEINKLPNKHFGLNALLNNARSQLRQLVS